VDLQSLQVAGKHPPLRVGESGQVFGTGLAKDTGGEGNEIAPLVHGTNGSVDIEVEFTFRQSKYRGGDDTDSRTDGLVESLPGGS
jgi:hypothetical protein